MIYRSAYISLCIILIFFCSTTLSAQNISDEKRYSFDFRGEPLSEVLEEIARETDIDLLYDPEIVKGVTIYSRVKNQPIPDLLNEILADTELDFITLSSGTVVIVLTVNDNPAYGSYTGKIVDSNTGEPLPGATVMLADASGGTSAGRSGTFALNKLVTGSYKIIFSYVGYEPVYKTIDIKPNQDVRERISMNPRPLDFSPIVVTDHLPQMPRNGTTEQSVDANSQWEATGRMQEAIRSLNLFPGVQYGLPMTDLHLQGGKRGDHRILLDGVPVYNPYSFGQMFSAFSPYAINKVVLHKAGYDVVEGSQIAGLVNLSHDVNGIAENRIITQADPLSANLRGDLKFSGNDNSSLKIMSAARSNYWDIYKEPGLDRTLQKWDNMDPLTTNLLIDSDADASLYESRKHNSDVRFHDVHLASVYDINSYNTLSSSFYIGENYIGTDLLQQAPQSEDLPEYLYARDEYLWKNFMGQLSYNYLVSPRLDLSTQLSFSSNSLLHRYLIGTSDTPNIPDLGNTTAAAYAGLFSAGEADQLPTQKNENSIKHIIFRTDGTYSLNPRFNLNAGLQLDHVKSHVNLSDLFYLPTESDQQSTIFSGYLNGNWRLGKYWKLVIGNRITLEHASINFNAEPRISIQLDRPDSGIGYWSGRISGGYYRQYINQYEITNPGPTSLVPSFTVWSHTGSSKTPEAWHLSGSFLLEPTENTSFILEVFYKWQPTAYTISYENLLLNNETVFDGFDAFANSTKMKTLGAGFRLNQSVAESSVKLMLGYDYSFNQINLESQFGRAVPTPWNEPHRFQLRTLWHVFPNLTAVAKWQSVLGRSWGFRQSYYNYLYYRETQKVGSYSFGNPENDRLSPFHQLDFSFIYKPSLKIVDMQLRLNLVNLLNRHNTIDWSLQQGQPGNDNQYRIKKRTMPGFTPSISIEVGI